MENTMKNILKGIGISIISTMIILFVFAIILTYTNVSENTITPVIITVTAISILLGSSIGNIKIKKNGIINGRNNRWKLHINTLLNFEYIKLELWFEPSKCNYDSGWSSVWNIRRNYRC